MLAPHPREGRAYIISCPRLFKPLALSARRRHHGPGPGTPGTVWVYAAGRVEFRDGRVGDVQRSW